MSTIKDRQKTQLSSLGGVGVFLLQQQEGGSDLRLYLVFNFAVQTGAVTPSAAQSHTSALFNSPCTRQTLLIILSKGHVHDFPLHQHRPRFS